MSAVAWAPQTMASGGAKGETMAAVDIPDQLSAQLAAAGIFDEATRVVCGGDRGASVSVAQARAALREFA